MKTIDLGNDIYAAELPNGDVELVLRHRESVPGLTGTDGRFTGKETRIVIPREARVELATLLVGNLTLRLIS
jgi:hypothetical protein